MLVSQVEGELKSSAAVVRYNFWWWEATGKGNQGLEVEQSANETYKLNLKFALLLAMAQECKQCPGAACINVWKRQNGEMADDGRVKIARRESKRRGRGEERKKKKTKRVLYLHTICTSPALIRGRCQRLSGPPLPLFLFFFV